MAIDTSARFPQYARSAEPSALAGEETMRRINDQAHFLTGFNETTIIDRDGNSWIVLAKPAAVGAGEAMPWDLIFDGENYTVNPGVIYTDPAKSDSDLDIDGLADPLDFGSGKVVCLSLTWDGDGEEVMELFSGTVPIAAPNLYTYDEEGAGQVTRAIYPLWTGTAGTMPTGADGKQYDGFWAKRFPRSASLLLQWVGHELDEDFQHVPIPILIGL